MNIEKLKEQNRNIEKYLFDSNKESIRNAISYLRLANLSELDIETIRNDLLGMAHEAQLKGNSFEEYIGVDIRVFCDNLISESNKKNKHFSTLKWINFSLIVCLIFIGIDFTIQCFKSSSLLMRIEISWNLIISIMIIIFVFKIITKVYKKIIIKRNEKKNKLYVVIGLLILFSEIVITILLVDINRKIILSVNVLYLLIVIVSFIMLAKYIKFKLSNER